MASQKTLSRGFDLSGVGVHSGKPAHLMVLPSESGGLAFRRTDLGGPEMPLAGGRLEARGSTTLIGEKFRVETIEHLLAALFAFGVGSAVIALDADEIPILDGSALPFVRAIEKAGTCVLSARPRSPRSTSTSCSSIRPSRWPATKGRRTSSPQSRRR